MIFIFEFHFELKIKNLYKKKIIKNQKYIDNLMKHSEFLKNTFEIDIIDR